MPLRIVANRPDPAVFGLPWSTPLAAWTEHVVPLPRGLSRHVVRIVRLGDARYALKETQEPIAWREYNALRDLQRVNLPAVTAYGVVTGRVDGAGGPLPAVLITRHLAYAMPYRTLFSHGVRPETLPLIVDALVVLLVRLHLADFYWGDVSLSNALFRRNAGAFAAYLVDAETGEFKPELSARLREYDVEVGMQNVFAELMDLKAGGLIAEEVDEAAIVELIESRYDSLWGELTGAEVFGPDEMWRIEQRVNRLNELGFDVEELDVVTDWDGDTVRIQPRVVELGHHTRELRDLTGLDVEDLQARALLNDIASFAVSSGQSGGDRMLVANQWLRDYYEKVLELIPPDQWGKLDGPQLYVEVLEHRWYLSERLGREADLFDTARDYVGNVLAHKPHELLTTPADDPDVLLPGADQV